MKISTIALGAAAIATLGSVSAAIAQDAAVSSFSAGSVSTADADGAFATPGKFMEPDGEKMFRRVCAACHMPDAAGAVGAGKYPALAKNSNLAASGYPMMVVLKGLNGMPALGAMMTDQQVADVVNYIRTHFGNKYKDAVKAEDVKAMR